jgi:hypothetical protein
VLNNYQIKLLAALFMVIDHVGVVFFPETAALRVIGRLSFPLFAWLLAEGERHTRNFRQYLLRLLVLGALSQPIYQIALSGTYINILLTLSLGLVTLRLSRRFEQYYFVIWATAIIAAELLRLEYGAYGMAVIWLLANFDHRRRWRWWGAWLGLHVLVVIASQGIDFIQFPAAIAPVLLLWTNHQKGSAARWFYVFYPGHMLLIWALSRGLGLI